ncbi:MAG: hypothetical protein H7Y22_06275 [Gemmatimonadaceae bacterium]|nr:hypothetical protein [Gloeobacterales cyanobacterium ES-bin-141]
MGNSTRDFEQFTSGRKGCLVCFAFPDKRTARKFISKVAHLAAGYQLRPATQTDGAAYEVALWVEADVAQAQPQLAIAA